MKNKLNIISFRSVLKTTNVSEVILFALKCN